MIAFLTAGPLPIMTFSLSLTSSLCSLFFFVFVLCLFVLFFSVTKEEDRFKNVNDSRQKK